MNLAGYVRGLHLLPSRFLIKLGRFSIHYRVHSHHAQGIGIC